MFGYLELLLLNRFQCFFPLALHKHAHYPDQFVPSQYVNEVRHPMGSLVDEA